MKWCHDFLIHSWIICFGSASWISLNSIFVESPILTQVLPEGWRFPAYVAIVSQIGNVFPLIFTCTLRTKLQKDFTYLVTVIHVLLSIGSIASFFIILFWHKTINIGDSLHSVPFLILVFFTSSIGCSSVITFPLFVSAFKNKYLISLILGEGLSGFIPSIAAMIQGIKQTRCLNVTKVYVHDNMTFVYEKMEKNIPEALFTPTIFFSFIFITLLLSQISFILLNVHPIALREREIPTQDDDDEKAKLLPPKTTTPSLKSTRAIFLLSAQSLVAGLSITALPSIQSYSTIPYGLSAYHLTAILTNMASPLATFVSFYLKLKSITLIAFFVLLVVSLGSYAAATAVLSPQPPFVGTTIGFLLIVTTWTMFNSLSSYVKVNIAYYFRNGIDHRGQLFWWSVATQCGSVLGAICSFILVNYTFIFHQTQPCTVN